VFPPISLILATRATDYIAGLTATRYQGDETSQSAHGGMNLWMGTFAAAATRSVSDAFAFEKRVGEIEEAWRKRVGRVRRDSATDRLIRALPGAPMVTVSGASELIGRSFQQTNEAISRLSGANVLKQVTIGKRDRAFEASEIVDAFSDLERQLGSPEGDTLPSPPTRRVPYRRP
jgi:hypothetical protein